MILKLCRIFIFYFWQTNFQNAILIIEASFNTVNGKAQLIKIFSPNTATWKWKSISPKQKIIICIKSKRNQEYIGLDLCLINNPKKTVHVRSSIWFQEMPLRKIWGKSKWENTPKLSHQRRLVLLTNLGGNNWQNNMCIIVVFNSWNIDDIMLVGK